MIKPYRFVQALACALGLTLVVHADPLGSAFTYQGQLATNTNAANGDYDFKFVLYGALEGGTGSATNIIVYDDNCGYEIEKSVVLKIWNLTLSFTNANFTIGSSPYTLTDVPEGTAHISAKTAWSLRRRLDVTFTNNQASSNND